MANTPTMRMLAQRNFLGGNNEGFIRKGQAFDTETTHGRNYIQSGLAIEMPARPNKEQAAAAHAADLDAKIKAKAEKEAAKSAGPDETKESTGRVESTKATKGR